MPDGLLVMLLLETLMLKGNFFLFTDQRRNHRGRGHHPWVVRALSDHLLQMPIDQKLPRNRHVHALMKTCTTPIHHHARKSYLVVSLFCLFIRCWKVPMSRLFNQMQLKLWSLRRLADATENNGQNNGQSNIVQAQFRFCGNQRASVIFYFVSFF